MKNLLLKIFETLDQWIEIENEQRAQYDGDRFPRILIRVLGHCSLILHPDVHLKLFATRDMDAKIEALSGGGFFDVQKKLKELLYIEKLELESDVHLIWIPKESTFSKILETPRLICEVLDPIYALCSKAVKAPEKNKILIRDALSEYGKPLENLILKYGGKLELFK